MLHRVTALPVHGPGSAPAPEHALQVFPIGSSPPAAEGEGFPFGGSPPAAEGEEFPLGGSPRADEVVLQGFPLGVFPLLDSGGVLYPQNHLPEDGPHHPYRQHHHHGNLRTRITGSIQ